MEIFKNLSKNEIKLKNKNFYRLNYFIDHLCKNH